MLHTLPPTTGARTLYRIASLVPSLTELVFALGLGPCLVARTGFCVHPREGVRAVPKVGGTKDVDLDRLRALAPTHVLVNVDENRAELLAALREFVPHVIVTHPCEVDDNLALFESFAQAFEAWPGVSLAAQRLADDMVAELALTRAMAWPARRVLYLIWRDPWMSVALDTYISRMLALVGWRSVPEVHGGASGAARYPRVEPGQPGLDQVDQVLLSSEPYRFGVRDMTAAAAFAPCAEVRLVDGELLSWYGPRASAGVRYLRALASRPA